MDSYIDIAFVILLILFRRYILEVWRKHYLNQIEPFILGTEELRIQDTILAALNNIQLHFRDPNAFIMMVFSTEVTQS